MSGYTVHSNELRNEVSIWETQSDDLGKIAKKVETLRTDRVSAGIFQVLVSSYGSVIDQISARCNEGQQRTEEIANALRRVASGYDKAESDGVELFKQRF